MLEFLRSTVYVRVRPERISLLHVESGNEVADLPVLAVASRRGKTLVVAVGQEAAIQSGQANITVANGFKHPRTLIADFTVAERTLGHFLKHVLPKGLFRVSPVMVIHPQALLEGGLTQVEIRAFVELGFGAGARKVYVWEGPELSKEDLRELRFSRAGGKLLHS